MNFPELNYSVFFVSFFLAAPGTLLFAKSTKTAPAFLSAGKIALIFLSFFFFFVSFLVFGAHTYIGGLNWSWTSVRLVRTFAFFKGLSPFYLPGKGPLIGGLNGPTFVLAYLPVAWFSKLPSQAMFWASLLTAFYFFLPSLLVLFFTFSNNVILALLSFLCFSFLSWESSALYYSATQVHGDAIALGLGLLSLFVLVKAPIPPTKNLVLGSALGVLAVLAKVTMAPLLVGLAITVLVLFGKKSFLRFIFVLILAAFLIAGFFSYLFGVECLIGPLLKATKVHWVRIPGDFNFFSSPAEGLGGRIKILVSCLSELFRFNLLMIIAAIASLLRFSSQLRALRNSDLSERVLFALTVVGVFMIPAALVSRAKYGGDYNCYSLCCYYLYLLVVIQFAVWMNQKMGDHRKWGIALFLVLFWLTATRVSYLFASRGVNQSHREDEAYRMILDYPKKLYFPFRPLAHLMAENRVYHSFSNIIDIPMGGEKLFKEQLLKAYVPKEFSALVIGKDRPPSSIQEYFPTFKYPHELKQWPNWTLLTESPVFDLSQSSN